MTSVSDKMSRLTRRHESALEYIYSCLNNSSEPEMQAITRLLLETDANPYSYLPNLWAGHLDSATDLESLLHMIHHALYDDGEISYPVVNGEPRIRFQWPDDDKDIKFTLCSVELDYYQRYQKKFRVEFCKDIFDFVNRHKEYHRTDIRSCYIHDAARHGFDFANQVYSKYAVFDPEWEFDDEVVDQVKKISKIFNRAP